MDRRNFLNGSAATLGLVTLGRRVIAQTTIGAGTVTTVSDGYLQLPIDYLLSGLPEHARALASAGGVTGDAYQSPCNVTVYKTADRVVLFDAGSGAGFQPSAGRLLESLDAIGVAADDVTDVIFTHGHPDHLWGVLDDFDDPLFGNARHYFGRREWEYWWDPSTVETMEESFKSFAVGAKRRLEAIEGVTELFDDGQEVIPDVVAMETPGHTPGHMSFRIDSGLVVLGDALTNAHISLAHPDWHMNNDHDPDRAAKTRVALLDMVAEQGLWVVGFHLPNGGYGRIVRGDVGYTFVGASE